MQAYYLQNKAAMIARADASYLRNKDTVIARSKQWRQQNPEAAKASAARTRRRPGHNVQKRKAKRARRRCNPEKYRKADRIYASRRYAEDSTFRLRKILRARVLAALKGSTKSARTLALLGCSIADLKLHLEAQWLPGMSWENYGKGEGKWEIDHIKACATFYLSDPAQQRLCFGFENLQPLWGIDNRVKGAR